MKKNIQPYLFLFFTFFSIYLYGYDLDSNGIVQPTSPSHLVNDFANLLTEEQITALENDLVAYNDSTSTQICIVTVDTLFGMPISDYALQLGRNWGIGQIGKNNGVLLLISKKDREVDIEVGYGLEAHLTDYGCRAIIQNSIVPNFKAGNYFQGISSAVYSIKYFIANYEATPNTYSTYQYQPSFFEEYGYIFIIILVFLLPFIFGMLFGWSGSFTGSSKGWTSSSGSSYSGTSNYSSSSRSSSSYSSGSKSFGGFGGGSFGGGGSSGKW